MKAENSAAKSGNSSVRNRRCPGISLAFNKPDRNALILQEEGQMKDLNERGTENQVKGTVKEMKGKIRG
ncbi:MAG TPA: hypothetical protein VF850_09895, partial [Gemmatimonadaceae bacterium]